MSNGTSTTSRWISIMGVVIGVAFALCSFGCDNMGTPVAISGTETVHYSGTATDAEATALGAGLQEVGFFGQGRKVDVLLKKGDGGTVVSFVVAPEGWVHAGNEEVFRLIGAAIAPSVGGKPLTVHLLDDKLNVKKEIAIGVDAPTRVRIGAKEGVFYSGTATEAEAKALGKALQDAEYFLGQNHVDAMLKKGPEGTVVSFTGQRALWSTPEAAAEFTTIGEAIAPSVGGKPIKLHLLDGHLTLIQEIEVK